MALFLPTLALLAIATLTVDACVCYVGQDLDQATGKRYQWSLAEQTPCACTEFRLGGVNMKPQKKQHEVKIGDDSRVSINEQGNIVRSPECNYDYYHEPATPCAYQATYRFQFKGLQVPLTSPIRLRFTVPEVEYVFVMFSPSPKYHEASYELDLTASRSGIRKRIPSPTAWVQSNDINYFGEHLIITYDNGHFEIAIPGLPESTLTYDIPSAPPTSWFISFQSGEKTVDWEFFEPCISEFNQ